MQAVTEQVQQLFEQYSKEPVTQMEVLPQSGSDRRYYRLHTGHGSFIGTYNANVKENQTFFAFTSHFSQYPVNLPQILAVNEAQTIYLQQDLGNESLLNRLEEKGYTPEVFELFQKSLSQLARMQIQGGETLNYDWCLTAKEFGKQAILSDLLYFKYYFVDTLKHPYDKQQLLDDFDALSSYLTHAEHKFFMFRDFQSRNIMLHGNEPYFIDYQGGMKGALQYDVASLLWQAKADLPDQWKNDLLDYYIQCINSILPSPADPIRFVGQYNGYVLIRLLQVLGAYGFRGLFERKAHFLTSIPLALRNLKWFIENKKVGIAVPELENLLSFIVSDDVVQRYENTRATAGTPLVIKVCSFSYKKSGVPKDDTENGGGFVFDCRGILNPGRFDEYKQLTGRDKDVKDFLEQHTLMPDFLNNIYNLVDISVEDYLKRGFSSLMICFGCTGGQHRSVYAADAVARHLRNKFGVHILLEHIEQGIKEERV
jgi:aminoglycoside/choline kinase family phosphotransferase